MPGRLLGRATCGLTGVPGAVGPGRCVCRWAAARPRAVRAASFARRVASKPGQAPPPPTGTAARPLSVCSLVLLLVCPRVFRAPSGPAAREIATREPKGSEWSISKPARALRSLRRPPHRRRCVADVWPGASARSPARPRRPRGGLQSGVRVRALTLPPPTGAAVTPTARRPRGGLRVGQKSYVFAGGKKFEWRWVTGQRVFLALLDALGVTPV